MLVEIERKVFELKELNVADTGEISGYAAVFGNVDEGGDVILPGAFQKAIPAFLLDGFLAWNHYWDMPVAIPTSATEDDNGLFIRAAFHTTDDAQKARTITAERIDAKKRMGLSIGYAVEEEEYTRDARLLKVINPLFEVSLVTVPMNRLANVTAVKGSLGSGMPVAERLQLVAAEGGAIVEHLKNRAHLRAKEGRVLSAANRQLMASLDEQLSAVRAAIRELLDATDPDKDRKAALAVLAEFEYLVATAPAVTAH